MEKAHTSGHPLRPHQGSYGDAALRTWAKRIGGWAEQGPDVYCYFDNDDRGFAPKNAIGVKELLACGALKLSSRRGAPVPAPFFSEFGQPFR